MKLLESFKLVHGMDTTRRYSNSRLIIDESILSHTACVALLSSLLYDIAVEASPELSKVTDKAVMLTNALVHDTPEVVTGDLPRSIKYWNESISAAYEEVEQEAAESIYKSLGISDRLAEIYADGAINAKNDLNGVFIRISDMISVSYKLYSEVLLLNNPGILLTCRGMSDHLTSLHDKVESILSDYPEACSRMLDFIDQARKLTAKILERDPELDIAG